MQNDNDNIVLSLTMEKQKFYITKMTGWKLCVRIKMSLARLYFPCKIQSPYKEEQIELIQVLMICRNANF